MKRLSDTVFCASVLPTMSMIKDNSSASNAPVLKPGSLGDEGMESKN